MQRRKNTTEVYQVKIRLLQISPTIFRRLLIRSDSTIAELHFIIQIVMGWPNLHLHKFVIHGKEYGISYAGGTGFSDDPKQVQLNRFGFRLKERFVYEYNFYDNWQHEIRIENILPLEPKRTYPVCISGTRNAPPDDCGGAWAFMSLTQQYPIGYVAYRVLDILQEKDTKENREELHTLKYWLKAYHFDRQAINQRLYRYVSKHEDPESLIEEVEQCV